MREYHASPGFWLLGEGIVSDSATDFTCWESYGTCDYFGNGEVSEAATAYVAASAKEKMRNLQPHLL